MRLNSWKMALAAFLLVGLVSLPAMAKPAPGLGVFSGVKFNSVDDFDLSHNFGFFVDLPLVSTFYLSPTADTYTLGEAAVTDLTLAFKFVIPLRGWAPYLGVLPGLSTVSNDRHFIIGGAGGAYIHLVANLSLLVQVEYKQIFKDEIEGGTVHGQGGLLFRF